MRTRSIGVVIAFALALVPGVAGAHDHEPPDALLVTETDSGEGRSYATEWADRSGWFCGVTASTFGWAFDGEPVHWVPGDDIAVRFTSRHRPSRVEVTGYLLGDPLTGTVIYGKVDVPNELRRVDVDGKRMWEAVLSPPPWPDLYLDVTARWRDVDGCGPQSSSWTFRAGLLPV